MTLRPAAPVLLAAVLAAFGSVAAVRAAPAPTLSSHILLDGELLDGLYAGMDDGVAPQQLRGHAVIETPRWPRRYGEDGLRTADFVVPSGRACTAYVQVTAGVSVVRGRPADVPASVAAGALLYNTRILARGTRRGGAWAVAEMRPTASSIAPGQPRVRRVQALTAFRVANRRQMRVGALADFAGTCTDAAVLRGEVADGLALLARRARFTGAIVPRHLVSGPTTTFHVTARVGSAGGARAPVARGTVSFITAANWTRTHLTERSAEFQVDAGDGCTAVARVTYTVQASGQDPLVQARSPFEVAADLRHGRRPGGAYVVMEPKLTGSVRGLYARGVIEIAPHRWLRLRVQTGFTPGCNDVQVRYGPVPFGLWEIVVNATADMRIDAR